MNSAPSPAKKESLRVTITVVVFRILFGLIGILVLLFIICELNKAYWDYRVMQMCEKDGGLHIFESITISHEEFLKWGGQDGVPGVPFESENRLDVPIFTRNDIKIIFLHQPYVWKTTSEYVRRSDSKIMARHIFYARRGGDFPSPMHESYFSCRNEGLVSERLILIKGNEK